MSEVSSSADHAKYQHEERDVRVRLLILAAAGLAIFTGTALLAMVWLFDYLATRRAPEADYPSPLLETARLPPEPRLQSSPQRDMRVMRGEENAVLGSYGWVDRQAGIVRIPITRAMELLANEAEQRR
jgi:hypothetical protein